MKTKTFENGFKSRAFWTFPTYLGKIEATLLAGYLKTHRFENASFLACIGENASKWKRLRHPMTLKTDTLENALVWIAENISLRFLRDESGDFWKRI